MKVGKAIVRGAAFVLGLAAMLGAAARADAAVLYRDSFEEAKKTRLAVGGGTEKSATGTAWRANQPEQPGEGPHRFQGLVIDLAKAGAHPAGGLAKGTISLWLQRGEELEREGIFSLTDASYDSFVNVVVDWGGWGRGRETTIGVHSHEQYPLWHRVVREPRGEVWSRHFPLGTRIAKGQWFNLAFTWSSSAADCGIFVDGRRVGAIPDKGFAMKRIVENATYLVIGAVPQGDYVAGRGSKSAEERALPGVYVPMRSLVDAVEIHDAVVTDFKNTYEDPVALRVREVEHNAARKAGFSGKLIAGDVVDVTVLGTPKAEGSFDVAHLPGFDGKIELDWRGWGVYLEEKNFFEKNEVNLRDVSGYAVYASKERIDPANPGEPVERLETQQQSYTLDRLERDIPYHVLVQALMRDRSTRTVLATPAGVKLSETARGTYSGSWKVSYQDRLPRAVIVGRLEKGRNSAALVSDERYVFAVDPALSVSVATDPAELKADERSTSRVSVTVTDANGNPVAGHKVRFLLATTSQYTGVVGGGAFTEQVGGALKEDTWGETDLFGKLSVTYIAGFAAKTAVIVARDMASNSTGAGYVKTFIQGTAQLELEPVNLARLAGGYKVTVTSSDEWLTADGKSQARITAKVTLNDEPVEGREVRFEVSSGTGSIRTVKAVTGREGEARAVYTAGKKIGMVVVTATDTESQASGSVQIELRSDAPAKLVIRFTPDRMPADGRSTAELGVLVTDINDNPNDNVEVEYRLVEGSGRLRDERTVTDRSGETETEFVAGTAPGRVTVELTVRSYVPSAEELAKARDMALAVTDYKFF